LGGKQVDDRVAVDPHRGKTDFPRFELIQARGLQTQHVDVELQRTLDIADV
jgi:hypothetical protein